VVFGQSRKDRAANSRLQFHSTPFYDRAMEHHFLRGARVYLSRPMDFVASRADEGKLGWRNRIGDFLRAKGAIAFDHWLTPPRDEAQE
jgi:hypothetical protein